MAHVIVVRCQVEVSARLIPRLVGFYRMCLNVIYKPQTEGGLGPLGLSNHKKIVCVYRYTCIHIGLYCGFLRAS